MTGILKGNHSKLNCFSCTFDLHFCYLNTRELEEHKHTLLFYQCINKIFPKNHMYKLSMYRSWEQKYRNDTNLMVTWIKHAFLPYNVRTRKLYTFFWPVSLKIDDQWDNILSSVMKQAHWYSNQMIILDSQFKICGIFWQSYVLTIMTTVLYWVLTLLRYCFIYIITALYFYFA
jgi:hypothetical protein